VIVTLAPIALAAVQVRARWLPSWSGAPARLADAIVGLSLLLVVLHGLGAIGLFRRGAIAVTALVVGTVLTVWLRRSSPPVATETDETVPVPRWSVAVVGALALVVVAQWITWTLTALDRGVLDYDSLTYHLPQAARFAQSGWITRLYFSKPEFPNMFHPADSEVLHAFGFAMFGRDFLSPLLNLGWLGFAMLAGWCVGRPYGVAPVTLGGTLVVLAAPHMAALEPGSALNDVSALAMLLAAVAVLLQPSGKHFRYAVAGAAAGVALGIKFTVLGPVGVLTLAVPFIAKRGERVRASLYWAGPLALTGAFWFLRNLFRAGSPVPIVHLGPLPFPHFKIMDEHGYTVVHYATDGDVWRHWFVPGLRAAMGPGWSLVFAAAAVWGIVLLARGSRVQRAVGVAAAAGVASYLVSPLSAFGNPGAPSLFAVNVRYITPGLVLALTVPFTVLRGRPDRTNAGGLAVMSLLIGLGVVAGGTALRGFPLEHRRPGVAIAVLIALGIAALWLARRQAGKPGFVAVALVATAALLVVGAVVERRYVDHRYARDPELAWLTGVHEARIGFVGFDFGYLLVGDRLDNHVQYVGARGPHGEFHAIETCAAWRRALDRGHYTYVVHRRAGNYPDHRQEQWTSSDPAAKPVFSSKNSLVFRVAGTFDPAGCPR
jgi:hypothetical protein